MAHSEPPPSPAYDIFAGYLRELQAGEHVDFDVFCAQHSPIASHLRELHRRWSDLVARKEQADLSPDDLERRLREWSESLDAGGRSGKSDDPEAQLRAVVERLASPDSGRMRLEERGEVARGAMGRVVRVWDRELRRSLAKKVLLGRPVKGPQARRESAQRLGRFLEEAQITAQLDHPGIVPVHDLGVDAAGQVYFTMKLVRGEDLKSVFEKVRRQADGWTLTRALGVIAKLCDAMAFAHSKNVVHRDLKPANVMVGRFGEVYVMDWGLARVLDRPETRDLRLREAGTAELNTERTDGDPQSGSPLRTMDGHVVGTPAYMPPEQARGDVERLGPRSDVYAVGAMLYHLLAGSMPYVDLQSPPSPYEVWNQVRNGPPRPIRELARGQPAELVSICEKAMARDPSERYADMRELAEDLSNFLEHRVVRAYRTGPSTALVKWTQRNPLVAGSFAALIVVSVAAALLLATKEASRKRTERRASDEHLAPALVQRAGRLWPIHPDGGEAKDSWLVEARTLVAALPAYSSELQRLRSLGVEQQVPEAERGDLPARARLDLLERRHSNLESTRASTLARLAVEPKDSPRAVEDRRIAEILDRELPGLRLEIERKQRALPAERTYRFATHATQREHDRLQDLVGYLVELQRPGDGLIAEVQSRLELSLGLARRSLEDHAGAWAEACADVADLGRSPQYEGLKLRPLLGLVPLRKDPASGLWEFWHVLSGSRPQIAPDGQWVITPDTGIVFVLAPGGYLTLGCDPESLDPATGWEFKDEIPPRDLELSPYLISKYELTQGQWLRLAGERCGETWAGDYFGQDPMSDLTHPVEGLDGARTEELLARWGLRLPTEAQWERAALSGAVAAEEWTPLDPDLRRIANLWYDEEQEDAPVPKPRVPWSMTRWDTYIGHSPVGFFPPNGWGLHDMVGNVAEWCRDGYLQSGFEEKDTTGKYQPMASDPRTGEMLPRATTNYRVLRGGSYKSKPAPFRLSARRGWPRDLPAADGGVRPSIDLVSD